MASSTNRFATIEVAAIAIIALSLLVIVYLVCANSLRFVTIQQPRLRFRLFCWRR